MSFVVHPEPISFAHLIDPELVAPPAPPYARLMGLLCSAIGALVPLPPALRVAWPSRRRRQTVDRSSR